jgi:hypothetical protein
MSTAATMSTPPSIPPAQPPSIPPAPPSWGPPGAVPPAYSPLDRNALADLKTFALLGIVGIIISVIAILGSNVGRIMTVSSGSFAGAISTGVALSILGVVGFIIGIIALLKARSAFKDLSTVDHRFSTPATLVLVFFVGMIFFILFFIALAAVIGLVIASAITASGTYNATPGLVAAGLALAAFGVLGTICFIVGAIGMILGLWRVGERYGEDMIKIGGILYIIPFVDIVAPILVYLGVNNAQKKLPASI